jgi:hypothetical protein
MGVPDCGKTDCSLVLRGCIVLTWEQVHKTLQVYEGELDFEEEDVPDDVGVKELKAMYN